MGYDEKFEVEATNEWLMRFNEAGFSDELMYVPSELAKLGVAPKDVVDSLGWLRSHAAIKTTATVEKSPARPASKEVAVIAPATQKQLAPVMVLRRTEDQAEPEIVLLDKLEEDLKTPMMEPTIKSFAQDYDCYGPWEWFGKVESLIEDAIRSVFEPESGLYEFNELSSLMRGDMEELKLRPRRKGRRKARANELVSSK